MIAEMAKTPYGQQVLGKVGQIFANFAPRAISAEAASIMSWLANYCTKFK